MKPLLIVLSLALSGCISHSLNDQDRARVDKILIEFQRLNKNIEKFNENFGALSRSGKE